MSLFELVTILGLANMALTALWRVWQHLRHQDLLTILREIRDELTAQG